MKGFKIVSLHLYPPLPSFAWRNGGDRRRQLALPAFRGLAYVWPGSNAPHVVVAVRDSQRQAWNIAVKIAGIGGAGWT